MRIAALFQCACMSAFCTSKNCCCTICGAVSGFSGIGICGTAAVYVATFFAVGVASDFRYGYFAVLATIAGCVAALAPTPRAA